MTSAELLKDRVCVDNIQGQIFKLNGKFYKCVSKNWIAVADGDSTGVMKDAAGAEYRTVVIGNQLWMKENMNIKTDSSYCYANDTSYCSKSGKKYGRLYVWSAAMKVCPVGWHLPSQAEWNTLIGMAESGKTSVVSNKGREGNRLKTKTDWEYSGNESDALGFSARPAGYYAGNIFGGGGVHTNFWISTECGDDGAYSMYLQNRDLEGKEDYTASIDCFSKRNGYSVRCIQD